MEIAGKKYESLTVTDKNGNVFFSINDDNALSRIDGKVYFETEDGQVTFRTNGKQVKVVAAEGTEYLELKKE